MPPPSCANMHIPPNVSVHYSMTMITFKTVTLHSKKRSEELISLLNWNTYHVNDLFLCNASKLPQDNKKLFIGQTNSKNLTFKVERFRPFYGYFLPHVIAKGQFSNSDHRTKLRIRFTSNILTAAYFIFALAVTFKFFWQIATTQSNENVLIGLIIWILLFLGVPVLLIIWEANKIIETLTITLNMSYK